MDFIDDTGHAIVACWNGAWALTSDNWAAIGTWATVAVAVVAAVLALNQLSEAKKTRDEQAQPNVVMFTEPVVGNPQFLDIVIKNFGQTPAFDVAVTLDSPPQISPKLPGQAVSQVKFPVSIPILAPQQEWRTLWDYSVTHQQTEGIKNRHGGVVKYVDSRAAQFETPVILDFSLLFDTRWVAVKTTHDVARTLEDELKSVSRALAAIATTLDGFTEEHTGVWAYPTDPDAERKYRSDKRAERDARLQGLEEQVERLTGEPATEHAADAAGDAANESHTP